LQKILLRVTIFLATKNKKIALRERVESGESMDEDLKKMLRQLADVHAKMMAEHVAVNYPVLKKIALEWSGKKVEKCST
jgi:hypothetical protein